jgi:putative tryptophan/tyrosine transport system substrate-binding protein
MRRREFTALIGGAVVTWPFVTAAQQPSMPVIGFLSGRSADTSVRVLAAFRKGLNETGYVEGQNVTVEYHWLEGQYDRLPPLLADLIRRQVAVIAVPGSAPAVLAAKAATAKIPIIFGIGEDPVRLGIVASLARPGGNATGINFFVNEVLAKRLRLLHDMVPKAVRVAVLVNPSNVSSTEATLHVAQEVAHAVGLQIQIVNATTISEIDAVFGSFARERPDALFVAPDGFFASRAVQLATLSARDKIPAAYSERDTPAVGGLMSYGADVTEMYHQVGVYTGSILKGSTPADMPVMQSTKFRIRHQPPDGAGARHRGAVRLALHRRRGDRIAQSLLQRRMSAFGT